MSRTLLMNLPIEIAHYDQKGQQSKDLTTKVTSYHVFIEITLFDILEALHCFGLGYIYKVWFDVHHEHVINVYLKQCCHIPSLKQFVYYPTHVYPNTPSLE